MDNTYLTLSDIRKLEVSDRVYIEYERFLPSESHLNYYGESVVYETDSNGVVFVGEDGGFYTVKYNSFDSELDEVNLDKGKYYLKVKYIEKVEETELNYQFA